MPDIFLSYSRDDQAIARRFAQGFEREGLSVWWDQTLRAGEVYDRVTEKALQDAKAVVVLWSKKSVESHWVRSEATQAQANGTLVPVMIESCKRPIMFELMHTAELAQWKGDASDPAWKSFLRDVRQFVKKEPLATSPSVVQSVSTKPGQFNVRILVGIVALLVVGPGMFWLAHQLPRVTPKQGGVIAAGTSATAAKEVTLAVLPFRNISSDPAQESFADGLSEELLNQLTQIRELRVTGRTSSFSFKDKNEDPTVIAEKLGVANLLDGTIRKDDKQLRITANLINGKDGTNLWSGKYDHELSVSGIIAMQEEIAKDVAQALSIKLDVGELSRAEGGTTNLEAYDKFLLAQTKFNHLDEVNEAARLYREATELDTTFWRAWYGLSMALAFVGSPQLSAVHSHLIESAPDSWAKQSMLAQYYAERHKWKEYEAASIAALAKVPATATLDLITLALIQANLGRVQEALGPLERAARTDPLTYGPSGALGWALRLSGRPDDVRAEYERTKDFAGDKMSREIGSLTNLMLRPDATPGAVQSLWSSLAAKYPVMEPARPLFDALDNPQAARILAQRRLQDPALQDETNLNRTLGYAAFVGDKETALAAMQRMAVAIGHGPLYRSNTMFLWEPYRTNLRTDPRFKEIVRQVGLVDYWRTTGNWGDFCKPVGKDDFECH